jgi:ribonuclease HII
VVAAAVILPEGFSHPLLNDSKQLTERQRELLRPIIEQEALAWGVGSVSPEEIDQINILKASFLAMHRAIDDLILRPQLLLIDGNRFTPYSGVPHECIVGGDGKYTSIAAASVLAKTHRDALMLRLATKYPGYALEVHKGYPTPEHKEAIRRLGLTPIHRKTFTIR